MLLDDQHHFIFVHIPKTGGTAVHNALEIACPGALSWPDRVPRISELPDTYLWNHPWHHALALEIKERIGEEKWDKFFSFAFVRNPWARFVSWYNMLVERDRWYIPEFPKFLEPVVDYPAARERRLNQVDYICDESGNVIVDFIGRFEHLQQDFDDICERIGVTTRRLRRENKSAKVDYRDYYTPELRQIIAERFARDIETFGYEF